MILCFETQRSTTLLFFQKNPDDFIFLSELSYKFIIDFERNLVKIMAWY